MRGNFVDSAELRRSECPTGEDAGVVATPLPSTFGKTCHERVNASRSPELRRDNGNDESIFRLG